MKWYVNVGGRLIACSLIIVIGLGGMFLLSSLKKEPAAAEIKEHSLKVETLPLHPEDVPVLITGYGEVRALDTVKISAQVAGIITEIHPKLEVGGIIPKDEVLFRIDARDYQAQLDQAASQMAQLENTILRLKKQYAIDQQRVETLQRSEKLANDEFERVKTLLEKDEVGTKSHVDQMEMAYNQMADQKDQLSQAVDLYPVRIKEAESALEGAKAMHDLAKVNLERTEVRAPFNARVKLVNVELGQLVSPGAAVLSLANDAVLEISVPLDSRDARTWLQFAEKAASDGVNELAWFGSLEPVTCKVQWTESNEDHYWEGKLHRVEELDQETRTVTVAIRLDGNNTSAGGEGLPLVEGMFCRVEIPGTLMKQVYRIPRWAINFDSEVYVAKGDRLEIRKVEALRTQGEETFVAGGVQPGESIITTRLVNPFPNSLLEVLNKPE
ncbi:MAG: HlyD family efflux transporter periplasmic adaptor subunit [Candidatus Hydrogenedentes bacterium]|nr:HlyD family efflux transporter periplasmic adaptor subunit [Candidatus Hydrogenedentota bacterium]